jgi:hypothetical protein
MRRRVRVTVAGLITALAVLPAVSNAEDKPDDKQECLAASEQGQNQRDDGLYRTARESFLKCSRDACPKVIAQSCTRWLRELDQDAPTVVLGAKDAQGNDLTDVTVLLDGKPFATLLDGKPLESDAGEHILRFERNGSVPTEQKLVLRAGEKARVVTVTLRSVGGDASSTEPEAPKSAVAPEAESPPETLFSSHHVTAGVLLLGAVAAGATGAVFLLASNQDKNSAASLRTNLSSDSCTHASTTTCQSLSDKVTSQHQDMNIATGLFAGAGVLAAGAVVAWLVWPHPDATQPAPQASIVPVPGGGVFQVAGGF